MWIIRKINPWQPKGSLFPIGNPAIFASSDKEVCLKTKRALEVSQLRVNPIPNLWEYWDVECSKEMIKLNRYLIQNHQFPILEVNPGDENYILDQSEIKHGLCADERFSNEDLLAMQEFIGIYYYHLEEITEKGKYALILNEMLDPERLDTIEFKIFDNEQAAIQALASLNEDDAGVVVELV